MDAESGIQQADAHTLRQSLGSFRGVGTGLIVLGVIAASAPFIAASGAENVLGAIFVAGGIMRTVHAYLLMRWKRSITEFLIALLYVTLGLALIAYPSGLVLYGVVYWLTFLTAEGALKIVQGLRLRPTPHWGLVLHSGMISLLLAAVMVRSLPLDESWAQGMLAGADLIFGGFSMVMAAPLMRVALREGKPYCMGDVCFQN